VFAKLRSVIPRSVKARVRRFLLDQLNVADMPSSAPVADAPSSVPSLPPLPVHGAGEFAVLTDAPTEMSLEERLFLYALVRSTKPSRVLEIGTAQGGSTMVIAAALEENGVGRIISIDPLPSIDPYDPRYRGRLVQLQAASPEAIEEAAGIAGPPFDLALIDGIHIYKQTAKDLAAALSHLGDRAYILLHDSFHFGVSEAIREALAAEPTLIDCGYVSGTPRPVGDLVTHAGFRLLRRGAEVDDPTPLVQPLWEALGKPVPHDRALINHDFWYCEAIEPCDYYKAAVVDDG
jgi:Methyltransferase domain